MNYSHLEVRPRRPAGTERITRRWPIRIKRHHASRL